MAEDDGKDTTQRKTISPYDLTTNDNPGIIITQVQLKGENYDEWARSIRTAMRARKKFGFINRTIKRPDENSLDLEDWCTINSLLVSWIRNTIEPTLRSTISHVEVAQDLWTIIKERFSVVNGPRIQQLKTELADCKHKGLTIPKARHPTEVEVNRRTRMWCAPTANTLDMSRRTVSYSLATLNGGAIVLVVMGKQVAVVEDNNSKRWDIVEVVDEVEHRVQMLCRQQEKDLPSQ
ncbi:hypothetical protein RJ640_009316 [Escallonia rubra]|uniref:Retrotransposon Copia-like N-terminal domain-containing protein n=1 Tax=Escallonia rubra TaxID=112253 RepID=A0AA88R7S1_9ASTE|nr:hypothetical protein RJ640_009316 [Escallonia rubra]